MTELNPAAMTPEQRKAQNEKVAKVVAWEQAVFSAKTAAELVNLAGLNLGEMFKFDYFKLAAGSGPVFPEAKALFDHALRENRLIYLPDVDSDRLFITGQLPMKLHAVSSVMVSSLPIEPAGLKFLPYKSVTVVPLVTGLNEILPVEQYRRHGFLLLGSKTTDPLEAEVDLKPLRMYANNLAIALKHLNG